MPVNMTVAAPASSEDKNWADRDAYFILQGLGVKPRNLLERWFQGPRAIRVIVRTQDAGYIRLRIEIIHDKAIDNSIELIVQNTTVLDQLLEAMQLISQEWLGRAFAIRRDA